MLFFGAVIFVFNQKTPFQWDDFKLAFVWPHELSLDENGGLTEPTQRISSFSDILISQYNHYFTWGGRTVVHIIAQFLLFINPLTADILNTLVYLLYVILIYYHVIGKSKHDVLIFIGINFLIWFVQPVFGETILWLTGSANYLWGTCIILLFLLPFRMFDNTKPRKYAALKCIGMCLLGIIAGWTNENTAAATIIITLLFVLYFYTHKWKIPAWAISGCIGIIAGYIIMIAAPGNIARAELRTEGIPMDLFHLSYRFLTSTQSFVAYLGIINLLGFILLLLFRKYSKENENYKYNSFLTALYFIGTLTAVYVMLFSPFFPPRAWFGAITFNIISFFILLHNLNYSLSFIRHIRQGLFIFGIMLFGFTLYEGYRDVSYIDNVWKERRTAITEQKQTGKPAAIYWTYSQTRFALSDPPFLPNVLELYYGVKVDMK